MPTASSAHLTRAIPFPDDIVEPVWQETRSFPVMAVGGPVVASSAIGAIGVRQLALHLLLGAAANGVLWLAVRARGRGDRDYTVSERFIAVEQRRGARVAIPAERLTSVTIAGDTVCMNSRDGVLAWDSSASDVCRFAHSSCPRSARIDGNLAARPVTILMSERIRRRRGGDDFNNREHGDLARVLADEPVAAGAQHGRASPPKRGPVRRYAGIDAMLGPVTE